MGGDVSDRTTLAERHAAVADLVDPATPLAARSVLANALLGAPASTLSVGALVAAASLFGITPGAARTSLSRMVSTGELTCHDGTYALAGHLVERRRRVDDAARPRYVAGEPWDRTWEINVVASRSRPPLDRLDLRNAANALHLAELREGVWLRPDNLAGDRLPAARAVVAEQCVQFREAISDLTDDDARALFELDGWADGACRLIDAVHRELGAGCSDGDHVRDVLTFRFLLSVAAIRHLQRDPNLPAVLLDSDWPADRLRDAYRAHDVAFKRDLLRLASTSSSGSG